ncbi:MAG: UDP-N-acetylmuramoyl-L-alanyl-D-glutamate--2,6-diaminopimelate ligase [Patescibacteria group bacterium]
MIKAFVRRLTPWPIISFYHRLLAELAAVVYGHPSEKLIVIGVTGTNGKSTTTSFIGQILEHAGHRVGWTSTATIKVADKEWPNDRKMTMLGRFQLQKLLKEMVGAGCEYAIIETSSQGIVQHRHVGINYDVVVFTNLTPEHIESHGGFGNYKQAKLELFKHFSRRRHKVNPSLKDGLGLIPKVMVVNGGDPHAKDFLACEADRKIAFEVDENLQLTESGASFMALGVEMDLPIPGRFNVENALAAVSVAMALDVPIPIIKDAVVHLRSVPGRFERIDEGQTFTVIVDYAYEPAALQKIFDAVLAVPGGRLIHVLGGCAGGRDVARRGIMGRMSGNTADICVVTNEDPYDEDPMQIIHQVADGARETGKKDDQDLFIVADRAEAIKKAIAMARPHDVVLITGKGSEPVMAVAHGKLVPWDDRVEARKAIHALWTSPNSSN